MLNSGSDHKTITSIVASIEASQKAKNRCALVTVVRVYGSSYRSPGARMLIDENGFMTGAISGGCLEGDALRKAMNAILSQKPRLVRYDTSDEDDAAIGFQLGCEGVIDVLFEPLNDVLTEFILSVLKSILSSRTNSYVATLFQAIETQKDAIGTCYALVNQQEFYRPDLSKELRHQLQSTYTLNKVEAGLLQTPDEDFEGFFIEKILPPIKIVIAGSGNDVPPLVRIASILGWETVLVNGKAAPFLSNQVHAGCQVLIGKPEDIFEKISLDERTAVVLMTHNYNYDLEIVRWTLPKSLSYIGVLGPKKKLIKILDQIEKADGPIATKQLEKLYGPTGLDIGAETPEEIAVSIVAEITAVMNNRNGGILRERATSIHQRDTI